MADSAVRGKAEPFRALPELPVPWYRTKTVPPDVPRYRPERYIVFNQDREEHDMIEQSPQRTALITGASRGLGLALARALADGGWTLIIDARGEDALESARAELSEQTRVVAIAGDVSDPTHRAALADAAREVGGLDALVNNASILGPSPQPDLLGYPLDVLEEVYRTNTLSPLALVQALRDELKQDARVVNVTS